MLRGEGQSDLFTWELIDLLGQFRKPSTLNGHAPYFIKWWAFTKSHQLQLFPASPLAVAAFLLESARGNHTASPTLNRCGALSYFCHLAGSPNPMDHPLCSQVRSALLRKLGIMGKKENPITSLSSYPYPGSTTCCFTRYGYPPFLLSYDYYV